MAHPGHTLRLVWAGARPDAATAAMVFVHGRGADARSILDLGHPLDVASFTWVAPQATLDTWYPHSFLAPIEHNEPALSSALGVVEGTVGELVARGFDAGRIHFCGFSQGACLLSEYLVRHPRRYGGALLFTGGVIGPRGAPRNYPGRFDGMPVFLGCGNDDPHVPLWRVEETASLFTSMGADVTMRVYPGRPHTVSAQEIAEAKRLLGRPVS
jgi:predicted esterase